MYFTHQTHFLKDVLKVFFELMIIFNEICCTVAKVLQKIKVFFAERIITLRRICGHTL